MFKENLIVLRKRNHLSQEELAEKIGVFRQTLSKYETGESLPDIGICKILADLFGVTLDDLVNYEIQIISVLVFRLPGSMCSDWSQWENMARLFFRNRQELYSDSCRETSCLC